MIFVKPIVFSSFAFERATTANYYDEAGVMTEAAIDELRLGYNPETLDYIGPIFESEATNYLLYSDDFSQADWAKISTPILVYDAAISPDGTMNATSLDNGTLNQALTLTLGNHVLSVFVKPASPAAFPSAQNVSLSFGFSNTTIIFSFYSNAEPIMSPSSGAAGGIQKLQDGWYRIYTRGNVSSANATISAANEFYICKAMVENGSAPTSYFESVATQGVRAADIQSDPPSVISSNILEDDYAEYDPLEAYDFEEYVTLIDTHRNYKSLIAGTGTNTGNYPPDNPDKWLDVGATNRWRMFDMEVGADLQSSNEDLIDVLLSLGEQIDSIALFNIIGSSAKVTQYYGEEIVYESEVNLITPPTESQWYNYWFDRRRQVKDAAFLNMPPTVPSSVRIQVFGTGQVSLGKAVIGYSTYLGFAEYGSTSIGITDYSTKEVDSFGNSFVQERRFVGNKDLKTVLDPGNELFVRDSLAEVRSVSSAYIVETQYAPILTLGFYKDFTVLFSTPASSYCSIQIEGI